MNGEVRLGVVRHEPIRLRIGRHAAASWYEGPYEVVPSRSEQVLATAQLTMRDDVTVHEIPYYETSNPYGKTYVIGD